MQQLTVSQKSRVEREQQDLLQMETNVAKVIQHLEEIANDG